MIYDAVYNISSTTTIGLIAGLIIVVLTFLIILFVAYWVECSWKDAVNIALLGSCVIAIIATVDVIDCVTSFRKKMLADPEYQCILGEAHALDVEAGKLLELAREIRKKTKEKSDE